MTDAAEGWFVADAQGLARGPLSRAQLQAEREAGHIGDEHLVWTLALAEWVSLRRALGAAAAGAAAAPAPAAIPTPAAEARSQTAKKKPRPPAAGVLPGTGPARPGDNWRERSGGKPLGALAQQAAEVARTRELQDKQARAGQALRRWLARQLDTALLGGVGWALLAVLGWKLGSWSLDAPSVAWRGNFLLALILLVIAAVPLEAVLVGLTGVSPGRALLGLRVIGPGGGPPGLLRAGERAARVALYGQGLLVFPFVLVGHVIAFGLLAKDGRTHWDRVLDLQIRTQPIAAQRWLIVLGLLGGAWAMFLGDGWMRLAVELLTRM